MFFPEIQQNEVRPQANSVFNYNEYSDLAGVFNPSEQETLLKRMREVMLYL